MAEAMLEKPPSQGREKKSNGSGGHIRSKASESSISSAASAWSRTSKSRAEQDAGPPGYKMSHCLGTGAHGAVYKAFNWGTGEVVAIKQIRLENIPQSEMNTITKEIDLLKGLDHPNIVKYKGYLKESGKLNIILEYCENGSLATILKDFGKFPEDLVAVYMAQALDGLVYLHDQGTIHRDIKGANILTTKEGTVKLADFGVATKSQQSREVSVVGTPYWMAPEIIQMTGASTASDIWSLGATIIELLEGKPPFSKFPPMGALFRIVNEDHPPLPGGASPAVRDFLLQCFQKDPNLRVSAKKLLKHPWIVNAKRAEASSQTKSTQIDDAIKSVQEWNEALERPPPTGSFRKSFIRPTSESPIPSRSTPSQPSSGTKLQASATKAANRRSKPDLDSYRSPQLDSDDNWELDLPDDFTQGRLQLPSRLRPQNGIEGLFSAEKLKPYANISHIVDDAIFDTDGERTVRSPVQFNRSHRADYSRPDTPELLNAQLGVTQETPTKRNPQLRQLPIRTAPKTPPSRSAPPAPARPAQAFREDSSDDWDDLVDNDDNYDRFKIEMKKRGKKTSPTLIRPCQVSGLTPPDEQNHDMRTKQIRTHSSNSSISGSLNGSLRRRTHKAGISNYALRRTASEVEMEKYAEYEEDDMSDLLEHEGGSLLLRARGSDSGSERGTLLIIPPKISSSIGSPHGDDDDEDDPFAQLDEEVGEMDLQDNIARDRHARLCATVKEIIDSLNSDLEEDDLLNLSEDLLGTLEESPDIKREIVTSHGLLPIVEVLENCALTDLQLNLLRIINQLIVDDQELQETLCLLGGIPVVIRYASNSYSTEIRAEVARFVAQVCQASNKTLEMFISCGGLKVLVQFVEEDLGHERNLVLVGVTGLWKVFELQGPTPKNDLCRILSRNSLLVPLSEVLSQILDDDSEEAREIEGRIAHLFLLFSQSENYVKEIVAERQILSSVLDDLQRMTTAHQITMLKFIKNLSMLPTTHDSLQNSGAIETLLALLKQIGLRQARSRSIANEIIGVIYHLCRLSRPRQEYAAKRGAVPLLIEAARSGLALRELALSIVCDIAHSGKSARKELWKHDGLQFYIEILSERYWATTALDAIFVWLSEETARVEQKLLQGPFRNAIVGCFKNNETTNDVFEGLLDPLQKLVRTSAAIAASLAQTEIFIRVKQKLHTKKPLVRVSLLKIILDICQATSDHASGLLRNSGLLDLLKTLQLDSAVLVKDLAGEVVKLVDRGPRIRPSMRRSSSTTITPATGHPLPGPLSSPQHVRTSNALSYFDNSNQSSLRSPRSRPSRQSINPARINESPSIASSTSSLASLTQERSSNLTPSFARPGSRDSSSGSAPSTRLSGMHGSYLDPKLRMPRSANAARLSTLNRLAAPRNESPTQPSSENVTPTHKPAWNSSASKASTALNGKRARRQTSGADSRRFA